MQLESGRESVDKDKSIISPFLQHVKDVVVLKRNMNVIMSSLECTVSHIFNNSSKLKKGSIIRIINVLPDIVS